MQVREFPAAEERFLLWQHEQATVLTTHPEVVLVILEQCPHIRCTQVERCALIVIFPQLVLATWHPTKSAANRSHKQVVMAVGDGDSEELLVAADLRQVEIVVIHLPVTVIKQSVDTGHQHTALVLRKARDRAIR